MAELRTLPHRAEAENAVLGGILLRGRDALGEVLELITEEDFYQPRAQAVFRAMRILEERGEPIDVITLEAQLRRTGELELVGGIEGLARFDRYATAHNIKAHAELVLESSRIRNLVVVAREIAEEGMQEVEDSKAYVDTAEQRVLKVNERGRKSSYRSSRELMLEVFQGITERQRQTDPITGVSTGFITLDEMTAGLQPSDLIILAARPSMGKTAFALNLAQNACIIPAKYANAPADQRPARYPVLFFSLEMGAAQLIERVLCSEARVDYAQLRRGGRMMEQDFRGLINAADRISNAPLYIDDSAAPSILELRARARRWRDDRTIFPEPDPDDPSANHKQLGLVMVDYLQLARGGKARYDSREQEISEISRGLKAMAKELKVPVIALSQLNRAVDSRADHRPQLSDLRESGAIEQDADVIMFIYREERYLAPDAPEEKRREVENKAEIIIGKQRNGPIGAVGLTFMKKFTRFENPAPEYEGGGGF
ncbi:replicative DNA helicase [Pseudenhygromyxa sp. WMMC2535]|uniref:replicative DNA helicase n=1 Tax=Pseudenhygromyxa sp. WMMC2535 TaxID=2712867 RepID=UPI00155725BF|nr:replicative DNA helicase [Pseudenhygromyxa sp. WMMC2535]NVB36881.1 replicative DNA helicase [Pseudenhygromyxa sp. WMMC2535]